MCRIGYPKIRKLRQAMQVYKNKKALTFAKAFLYAIAYQTNVSLHGKMNEPTVLIQHI